MRQVTPVPAPAVGWRRRGNAVWLPLSGARPRLELTVCVEEDAKNLRNERSSVYGVAMYVLVVLRVAFEACVQVARQHDADLNGAKCLGDACEFHIRPSNRAELELPRD